MRQDRATLKLWITTRDERRPSWRVRPYTPGEILADELVEIGLTAKKLADVIDVPPHRLSQLIAGKRAMTADTALRLRQYFGMSATFWMNLQSAYELDLARKASGKAIQRIPPRSGGAATGSGAYRFLSDGIIDPEHRLSAPSEEPPRQ